MKYFHYPTYYRFIICQLEIAIGVIDLIYLFIIIIINTIHKFAIKHKILFKLLKKIANF